MKEVRTACIFLAPLCKGGCRQSRLGDCSLTLTGGIAALGSHGSFSPGGENVPKRQTSAAAAVATLPPHLAGRLQLRRIHSCQAPASQPRHVAPQHAHPGGGSVGAARQGEAPAHRIFLRPPCAKGAASKAGWGIVPQLRLRPCRGRARRTGEENLPQQ